MPAQPCRPCDHLKVSGASTTRLPPSCTYAYVATSLSEHTPCKSCSAQAWLRTYARACYEPHTAPQEDLQMPTLMLRVCQPCRQVSTRSKRDLKPLASMPLALPSYVKPPLLGCRLAQASCLPHHLVLPRFRAADLPLASSMHMPSISWMQVIAISNQETSAHICMATCWLPWVLVSAMSARAQAELAWRTGHAVILHQISSQASKRAHNPRKPDCHVLPDKEPCLSLPVHSLDGPDATSTRSQQHLPD